MINDNKIICIFGVDISGIQCDNTSCDFKDETVSIKDYKNYINKQCPKCGSILLTEKDYMKCIRIANRAYRLNYWLNILIPRFILEWILSQLKKQ